MVDRRPYLVSRLIWKMAYGWDPLYIDHIDHNPGNNRLTNLREVSHQGNQRNRSLNTDNTSGHSGVVWHQAKKAWRSQIRVNGLRVYGVCSVDKNRAVESVLQLREAHNFHLNHGALPSGTRVN